MFGLFIFGSILFIPFVLLGATFCGMHLGIAVFRLKVEELLPPGKSRSNLWISCWVRNLAAMLAAQVTMITLGYTSAFFGKIFSEWGVFYENAVPQALIFTLCIQFLFIILAFAFNYYFINKGKYRKLFSFIIIFSAFIWEICIGALIFV